MSRDAAGQRSLLLAGATGLVGGLVLRELLADASFAGSIVAPTRHELALRDARLITVMQDFSRTGSDGEVGAAIDQQPQAALSCYISCLGTTIKTAGSRAAFIAVDRELVLRLAKVAFEHGARHAVVVSSAGASRQSANFYLRVKGEVEDAMAGIGFDRVDILRPGLLLGTRKEKRSGEAIAQVLAPLSNLLLLGTLRRYRAVAAEAVAGAIVKLTEETAPGHFIHEHDSIMALAM